MVKAVFRKCDFGIYACEISNHAGEPLICSAVSALGMTLVGTLQKIPDVTFNKSYYGDGHINIDINPLMDEDKQHEVDTVFKTIYIGLKQLEATYPNNVQVEGQI